MTLAALGSLGEFIGAFAVLVTLVYLAWQTRQNTQLLKQSRDAQAATMATANVQNWHGVFSRIVEDPEVAAIVAKLERGEVIEDDQTARMGALLFMDFLNVENLKFQMQLNSWSERVDDAVMERFCRFHIDWLLSSPSSRQWWDDNRMAFGDEFVELVDRLLEK